MVSGQEIKRGLNWVQAMIYTIVTVFIVVFVLKIASIPLVQVNTIAEANTDTSSALTPTMKTSLFEKYIFTPLAGGLIVLAGILGYALLISVKNEYDSSQF